MNIHSKFCDFSYHFTWIGFQFYIDLGNVISQLISQFLNRGSYIISKSACLLQSKTLKVLISPSCCYHSHWFFNIHPIFWLIVIYYCLYSYSWIKVGTISLRAFISIIINGSKLKTQKLIHLYNRQLLFDKSAKSTHW